MQHQLLNGVEIVSIVAVSPAAPAQSSVNNTFTRLPLVVNLDTLTVLTHVNGSMPRIVLSIATESGDGCSRG